MDRRRIALPLVLLAFALFTSGSASAAAPPKVTKVTVTMTEFSFTLSKATVPHGTVIFTVVNKGKAIHDFVLTKKLKTPRLGAGKKFVLKAVLKAGRYDYVCDLPRHEELGMSGTLNVT